MYICIFCSWTSVFQNINVIIFLLFIHHVFRISSYILVVWLGLVRQSSAVKEKLWGVCLILTAEQKFGVCVIKVEKVRWRFIIFVSCRWDLYHSEKSESCTKTLFHLFKIKFKIKIKYSVSYLLKTYKILTLLTPYV